MASSQRIYISLFAIIACIGAASAQYSCSPELCKPPACTCATQNSPLPVDQMPQFILFTHDDSTNDVSTGLIKNATAGFKNPNGCPLPATFFTMQGYTSCDYVKAAYDEGNEIAAHTLNHQMLGTDFKGSIEKEIIDQREWLINNCSIPAEDVVGHRSPYLINNPKHREALVKGGFLYDSTINEHWPNPNDPEGGTPTSPSGDKRVWPYTMDNGIPQNCAWTSNLCTPAERYPGLWEVPVWVLQTDSYPSPAYAMDPCDGLSSTPCDALALMKSNFELAYNGNKAPFPIYIHSPWLSNSTNMGKTREFIKWATTTYPDAYFVTMHQLVQWMQNPVPKDQVGAWLGCVPGGKAAGTIAPAPTPTAAPVVPEVVPAPVEVAPAAPTPEVAPAEVQSEVVNAPAVANPVEAVVTPIVDAATGGTSRAESSAILAGISACVVAFNLLLQ